MSKFFASGTGLIAAAVLLLFTCQVCAAEAPRHPEWVRAEALYQKRLWIDAEKAFLAYAKPPPPPDYAEALIKAAGCRLHTRNATGARILFEKVAYDNRSLRQSPEVVAEAFDRLHALLLSEGKPVVLRARMLADARSRLKTHTTLSRMCEREADTLLADGRSREALKIYADAGAGLSSAGTNVVRLIASGLTINPPPLSEDDAVLLAKTAEAKPACAAALCTLLAQRREGWRAEDVQANRLLRSGKAAEAVTAWDAMLRGRRGPADRLALSRAEALAVDDPKAGLDAYSSWLSTYPNSPWQARAEVQSALLQLKCGNVSEAIKRLEAFLTARPGSPYAAEAAKALARGKRASEALAKSEAVRIAQAKARAQDPVTADLERAEELLARGRFAEAAKGFEIFKDRRNHPQWGRAWYGLGQVRRASGDSDGALAAWNDLWRRALADPKIPCAAVARRATGDVWLEDLADPARALIAYDEAVARDPAVAAKGALDLNRGLALLTLGRGTEAQTIFTRRRDAAGEDKVEFLRWDTLVALCAAGRLKSSPRGALPAVRKATVEATLADSFLEAQEYGKALKLYRRAAKPLTGQEGADRCDLGAARALTQLGRTQDALALYARFEREHRQSALAPGALLRAGVLCAGPRMNDFGKAHDWFAKVVANHRGTPEAEAAEFYSATLAWRGRKWAEAQKLHKAFAAAHPDSPLARVALDERLPAIAKKSLAVPLEVPLEVTVFPGARKRKAIPITQAAAYNAQLNIVVPENSDYVVVKSEIVLQDRELWTGPDPKTPSPQHTYYLCHAFPNAFSSQEFVIIEGTVAKPTSGGGGGGHPPNFDVTVPSVDVDWTGFHAWGDENGEDTRYVIAPLTTNVVNYRWLQVNTPRDDYSLVHPVMTLRWAAPGDLRLWQDRTSYTNSVTIDAKVVSTNGHWPVRFCVEPLVPTFDFVVRLYGEADSETGAEALDTIHGRIVNVDLDVDADYDGDIDEDDDPLEEDPGGLVCVCSNNLTRIELKLEPANLPGRLTLSETTVAKRIRVWENGAPITLPKTWPANAFPATLSVEGTNASAFARDVELRLEYDENPVGQNNPLFKCADIIRLTVIQVELANLKFNHDTKSSANDAINIRQDYNTPINISNGEWIKGGANYPAAYTANNSVTVKARFTVRPATITSADIWAVSTDSGGSLGDVIKANVTFAGGVSIPEYAIFQISGTTPNCIQKTTNDVWQWKMVKVNGSGIPACDLNTSGPHTVYTILNEPVTPWVNTAGSMKNAWTEILDYSCNWATTATDEGNTVSKITTGANFGFGKTYDGSQTHTPGNTCHLTAMVSGIVVDCRDMSAVVELFTRILGGATVQFQRVNGPFYYKRILPIGRSKWEDGGWNFHQFGWHGNSVHDACVHLKESAPYVPVHDDLNGNYKTNLFDSGTWSPLTPDTITDFD